MLMEEIFSEHQFYFYFIMERTENQSISAWRKLKYFYTPCFNHFYTICTEYLNIQFKFASGAFYLLFFFKEKEKKCTENLGYFGNKGIGPLYCISFSQANTQKQNTITNKSVMLTVYRDVGYSNIS